MSTAREVLRVLSGLARAGSKALPGVGSTVAGAAAEGFGMAADLIDAGHEPVAAMRSIRDRAPIFAGVEREWEAALDRKFGPAIAVVERDIYEDGPDTEPGALG